jgi:hypothetical protein
MQHARWVSGEMNIKEPTIVNNFFDDIYFKALQKYAMGLWANCDPSLYSEGFGRYQWANTEVLNEGSDLILPRVREFFKSDSLKPSWNLLVVYEGSQARLWKHVDDNACSYTVDLCLFQKQPWDLWVIDKPYSMQENDVLFMHGNHQEHWREDFPDPKNNLAAYVFYFFCEPDHWYFTEGPSYLDRVIRAKSSST